MWILIVSIYYNYLRKFFLLAVTKRIRHEPQYILVMAKLKLLQRLVSDIRMFSAGHSHIGTNFTQKQSINESSHQIMSEHSLYRCENVRRPTLKEVLKPYRVTLVIGL